MTSYRKCFRTQVLILIIALVINAHAGPQKPINLVYITFFAYSHNQAQLCKEWSKEIEKRTQGAVEIAFMPGEGVACNMQSNSRRTKDIQINS